MKGLCRKAAAFAAAVAMCLQGITVSAFTDPAQAYAEYTQNRGTSSSQSSSADNTDGADENTQSDELADDNEVPEDELHEEETQPTVTVSKADSSKIKKPASEITIYSYQTSVTVGDKFKVACRMKPSKSDDIITYTSSNPKVATVDEKGNVTALAKGSAIITAKATSGVKDRFSLTVKAAKNSSSDSSDDSSQSSGSDSTVSSSASSTTTSSTGKKKATDIELKHSAINIYEGEQYTIQYELTPSDSTDTVTYRSLNRAVASVDSNGVVTARGAGNTRIVCTTSSGKKVKLNVTVQHMMTEEEKEQAIEEEIEREYDEFGNLVPTMVRFGEESVSVRVGETVSLDARVYPSGAKYTYTIGSNDTSVATVDSMGNVTGVSEGAAIITIVTDNGKSDTVYVTVYGKMVPGIDVSKWNGEIDWKKVKSTGKAGFVMIRSSYGYEDTDPMLDENVRGCEKYNIPYGFYHYMYARNVSEAKKEAAYFLNVIAPYSPQYPVVLDIEEPFYDNMSRKEVTNIIRAFMEEVENAGYYAMIYSFATFFDSNVYFDQISDYDVWVACWGDEEKLFENYSYHYGIWQYSEDGRIAGIDEDVDLNYCYKNYLDIIRKYGLNRPKY